MQITLTYNGQTFTLHLTPRGRAYLVELDGARYTVETLRAANGRFDLRLSVLSDSSASGGLSASPSDPTSTYLSTEGGNRWVTLDGRTYCIAKSVAGRRAAGHTHHAAGELTAPMPGQVRAVNVNEGDAVTRGQTLLILEAMKMEIRIQAPADGVVQSLRVQQGQTVERDQLLVILAES
ncbi:MAG: biotin/lipoyl-containing protein [Anaerolineales bacterium]